MGHVEKLDEVEWEEGEKEQGGTGIIDDEKKSSATSFHFLSLD